MELHKYQLPDIEMLQSSHARALTATNRLLAFSDTKWTDFLLPDALRQLDDELLACALNLRRVLESQDSSEIAEIVPHFANVAGREPDVYETSLWKILGMIVHHKVLKPTIVKDDSFYGDPKSGQLPGYMVTDTVVESDRGERRFDVAGFAIAAANELGKAYKSIKSGAN